MHECVVCGKFCLDEDSGLCRRCCGEVATGYRCVNCLLLLPKRKIRSERTAETYKTALRMWARSTGVESPDIAIEEIRSKGIDPYTVLQDFVNQLHSRKLAPKTILSYEVALKGCVC